MIKIFSLLILLFLLVETSCAKNRGFSNIETNLGYLRYESFSIQKASKKLIGGYPVYVANMPVFEFSVINKSQKKHKIFATSIAAPFCLTSDDGLGNNLLLKSKLGDYFRITANYDIINHIIETSILNFNFGFASQILIEHRKLNFMRGTSEANSDISLFIGPKLEFGVKVCDRLFAEICLDSKFSFPWINFGRVCLYDQCDILSFKDYYYGFYYQTNLNFSLHYKIRDTNHFRVGFRLDNIVGFSGPKPSFQANNILHFKIDRLQNIYISYFF
ncbi:MAG: hypothetical protein AB9833_04255 [Bacteroidales bacterium]